MARSSSTALGVYGLSRDDEKSSIAKTLDDDDSLNGQRTPTWATRSRKRSFADTGFPLHDGTTESGYDKNGDTRRGSEADFVGSHSSKKSRTGQWPLSTNDESPSSREKPASVDATGEQNASQTSDGTRPSRFVEGSMNDRVSRAPPQQFLEYENMIEQYANGIADVSWQNPQRQSHEEDGSKRSLGIFKFGKSVVTAFSNAFNYTTEMTQKLKPEREVHERRKREIREQKERYLAAYAAQKKSGGFDPVRLEPRQKHDSGVHMGNSTSLDLARGDANVKGHKTGQVDSQDDLDAKGFAAETPSIRRPRVLIRGQSIANLRKAKSDAHLSNNYQSKNSSTLSNTLQVPKTLRKQPSKKDLQKQQKLSKKVGELESKLELAKRQLQESLGEEIPPVPPVPQVPSSLASLSNEHVSLLLEPLSNHVDDGDGGHGSDEEEVELVPVNRDSSPEKFDGATLPTVRVTDMPEIAEEAEVETPESRAAKRPLAGTKAEAKKQTTKKRKGNEDHGTFRPDPESESEFSTEPKEASPPRKRRIITPRKPSRPTSTFKVPTPRPKQASKLPRPRSTSPPPSLSYSKPSPGTTTRSSSMDPANPSASAFAHHIFTATPHQDTSIPPLPKLSKKMERILNIAANGGESPRPFRTGGARGTTTNDSDDDGLEDVNDDDTGDTDELGLGKRVKNVDGTSVRGPVDPIKKKPFAVLSGRGDGVHVSKAQTKKLSASLPGRGEVVNASKAEEFEWDADIF